MSVSFGGGTKTKPTTQTMTRNVAPPSQQEALLQMVNQRVAQQQAEQLQRAMQQQQQFEASPFYNQLGALQGQAAGGLQGIMGGQLLLPAQQAALAQLYQSQMDPYREQMTREFSNMAARRGQTLNDSPVGGEFARALASYGAQMGGQQAQSALQLSQQNRGMFQDVLNFGNQLRQQADQNRLQLAQAQPGSYGFGQQLAQNRIAQAPITQQTRGGGTTQRPQFGLNLGNVIQGAQGASNLWYGQGKDPITGGARAGTAGQGLKNLWFPSKLGS